MPGGLRNSKVSVVEVDKQGEKDVVEVTKDHTQWSLVGLGLGLDFEYSEMPSGDGKHRTTFV